MKAESYLKTITAILKDSIRFPDKYQNSEDMAIVCEHLSQYSQYCKLKGKIDYAKTFKKMGKLFQTLYDKGRRQLCRIQVLEDKNVNFQRNPSIEGSQYVCVIPAKGAKLTILECLDGTTVIEFWNTKIEVPTRIVKRLKQIKRK